MFIRVLLEYPAGAEVVLTAFFFLFFILWFPVGADTPFFFFELGGSIFFFLGGLPTLLPYVPFPCGLIIYI